MRMRILTPTAVFVLALAVLAVPAGASTLTIQFTGLDLFYDGQNILDAGGVVGGLQDGQVDALSTMAFYLDADLIGTMTSGLFADVTLGGVGPIAAGGDMVSFLPDPAYGFDLYMDGGASGIALDWDSPVTINHNGQDMTVLGSATTGTIVGQALPFGLVLGTPVVVSFSTQIVSSTLGGGLQSSFMDDREYFTSFHSFGTGEVSGPSAVPEPATLLTVGLGLLGGGISARRRRRD